MNILAKANATKLIDNNYYDSPSELDLEELLYKEGLKLKEEPLLNCEGKIIFNDSTGIITVNSNIKDANQKRFTVAHEMGHFFNEKVHTQPLPKGEEKVLTPPNLPFQKGEEKKRQGEGFYRCGYNEFYGAKRNFERESNANDFAAELLMHEPWFVEKVKGKKLNVELLKETAAFFDVSLSATALRYTEIGHYPCAVVMTTNGVIKWKSASVNFPYQFLRVKEKVSELSYTSDYYKGDKFPKEGEDIPARAWFPEDYNLKDQEARIMELIIPYPSYNSALVVLWEE